ncbi:MAG: ThiF family adenylyltransferase [Bdellovibrio sp.]|nr:ThiF family adenylyltransferase [Bdellovibrio sp.]
MKHAKIRISKANWDILKPHLLSNFPKGESATFFECGWKSGENALVISITSLNLPKDGDLTCGVSSISLHEGYSLRQALQVEKSGFAPGLIHSHPEGYHVTPSRIDDKMDAYYAEYFSTFAPERPFVSLIYSEDESKQPHFSGRVFWKGQWLDCLDFQITGESYQKLSAVLGNEGPIPEEVCNRLKRLTGVMGLDAARRLWGAKVGIVGAGGTGSALFHSLVRACVGSILIIDDDTLSVSNAERIHGIHYQDLIEPGIPKVDILKRFAHDINPAIEVIALKMSANTDDAMKHLIECDVIFGCTDTQVGKVLISNIATQFLIPTVHLNVAMETDGKKLRGQVIQINQYAPGRSCVYCRDIVNVRLLAQELMSESERKARRAQANSVSPAKRDMYWIDEPVIHTVGSLTTIAAEYASTIGIGILTNCYGVQEEYFELDTIAPSRPPVTFTVKKRSDCICGRNLEGYSAQGDRWL